MSNYRTESPLRIHTGYCPLPIAHCPMVPDPHKRSGFYTFPMPPRLARVALIALLVAAGFAAARRWRTEPAPGMRGTWKPV